MTKIKATFVIVTAPKFVMAECPYCEEGIEIAYDEAVPYSYPYDVIGDCVTCPECLEEIEIEDLEWD